MNIWVEKYRPKELSELIGNDNLKNALQKSIDDQDINHILFWGSAGTGKTTISKILLNKIDCDKLILNGSDENSVDVMRNKIKNFASSVSIRKFKIVFIDEFDYVSLNAQATLRNMMEVFSKSTRFLCTCNYPEKIIPPIMSRFQIYEIKPPDMQSVRKRVDEILKTESVTIADEGEMKYLFQSAYPDIRKIINTIQKSVSNGVFKLDKSEILSDNYKVELLALIKENLKVPKKELRSHLKIRKLLADSRNVDYATLFKLLFDNVDDFLVDSDSKAKALINIGEYLYRDAFIVDKEINFMTLINLLFQVC